MHFATPKYIFKLVIYRTVLLYNLSKCQWCTRPRAPPRTATYSHSNDEWWSHCINLCPWQLVRGLVPRGRVRERARGERSYRRRRGRRPGAGARHLRLQRERRGGAQHRPGRGKQVCHLSNGLFLRLERRDSAWIATLRFSLEARRRTPRVYLSIYISFVRGYIIVERILLMRLFIIFLFFFFI